MPLPLEGVKVLELGLVIAGPAVGLFLAELGADVVAVEAVRGDASQRGRPALAFLKRNKRSVALDLHSPAGRELFLELARDADVVVENYGPGLLERIGLGYAALAERNPRLVYCSIKGFLPGPYGHRKAADEVAQMMGGLAYMTGPPGRPLRAGASITDLGTACFATIGILAALRERDQTGRGQQVSAALYETVVFWMSQHLAAMGVSGEAPEPLTVRGVGDRLGWPVYDPFETADQRLVFVGLLNDRHWQAFCAELDLPALRDAPEFATNQQRLAHRPTLLDRLAAVIRGYTRDELLPRLERADVAFAPINTPADLVDDPHLRASGQLLDTEFRGKRFPLPALPLRSGAHRFAVRRQPAPFGADTVAYLRERGYDDARIQDWLRQGVIGDGSSRPSE